ncbi:MAG: fasciclin domain-containing protein [Nostocaceae cyanobacterium]|nr:fasciclin domain-containing protein [Nostocaceae cyanobacterium]
MRHLFCLSSTSASLLAITMATAVVSPVLIPTPTIAQVNVPASVTFADVPADYWASPFIQVLAQNNIISGYPDGTFKPERAVQRAEFAAMIQKAFDQPVVRQLEPGGFRDVPVDYWAAAAIQEAYETGFMSGYPNNLFQPTQNIPKVQAIVALTSGLGLTATSASEAVLSSYYNDFNAIPNYAINSVTAATAANMVVNYPNIRVLNPQRTLTRAEAAALLYQALVKQGRLQPIASNLTAASYIVVATTSVNQDIVSIASSSDSFRTLTSLLQTAGLVNILQQPGEFTVFAPTDQAFAALSPETLQQLQQPENREVLIKILRYHVLSNQLTSNQLSSGEVTTFEGQAVNVKVDSATNQVAINDASVIQADVQASNGVIHVIDQVLLPPDVKLAQEPEEEDDDDGDIKVGRGLLGGRSYIGIGGNIGLGGETALGDGSFAVISKLGLTRNISVRPGAMIGDDTVILVPVTYDFSLRSGNVFGGNTFSLSPYIGAGVAIETSDDSDVGFLLTGGVDVPFGSRFTATGAVNAAFYDDTDVGLVFGVGYNF